MPPRRTIKAREHHGANSLDLTIPADVCKECDLRPGDVFAVTADCADEDEVVLRYRRVYAQGRDGSGAIG